MKVSEYIDIFRTLSYPALFSDECLDAMKNIRNKYGELDSSGVLYEIILDKPVFTADFSCLLYDEILEYHWFEFDFENYSSLKNIAPCVFLEKFCKSEAFPAYNEQKMLKLFGREKFEKLKQPLTDLAKILELHGTRILNLGNLDCRGKEYFDIVRVEVRVARSRRVVEILKALSYSGDLLFIEKTLQEIEPYIMDKLFTISFDLFHDRISDKIGFHFFPFLMLKELRDLMSFLVEKGYCLPEKADALLSWKHNKIPEGLLFQEINHFKIQFEKNKIVSFKAYLNHSDIFIPFHNFRM